MKWMRNEAPTAQVQSIDDRLIEIVRRGEYREALRQCWHLHQHASPEQLARGLGVGFLFGVLPVVGLQIACAVVCAHLIKGNKFAAAAMTLVSNPLTAAPIYGSGYAIGRLFVDAPGFSELARVLENFSYTEFTGLGADALVALALGCLIMGCVGGLLVYFVTRFSFRR